MSGCPHLIFAVPTLLTPTPGFPGSGGAGTGSEPVPVALDLDTGGHFLVFRLRVDATNLEPSPGACRRWFLQRVARAARSGRRSFCHDDSIRFDLGAGVEHSVELAIESQHTVVRRVVLRPGENVRWRMPIRTGRIELRIQVESGQAYTVEGREEGLDLRRALAEGAPSGTRWDLDAYEATYQSGVEVGSFRIRFVRDADGEVLEDLAFPLYSGRMGCEPPFCPQAGRQIVETPARRSE